jgi:osmoprotectant transport system substrate-binding protein
MEGNSMYSRKRGLGLGIIALGLTATLAACSSANPLDTGDSESAGTITIGSQGFSENEILAQVYGQVLEANGYTVEYNTSIGEREGFMGGLQDGSIDLIPEYAGNLLYGTDPGATASSEADVVAALPAVLEPLNLVVLDAAPGQDADAFVVTSEFSEANGVTSIADLAPIADTLTLAANTPFEARWFGKLAETYGVEGLTFKAIDDFGGAGTLGELLNNTVQIADIYTTTPSIKANNLVVLDDPESMIPVQNVIPLLNKGVLTDELASLLNKVSAKITTDELIDLNTTYAGDDKPSAEVVAKEWLTKNGFLK